MAQLINKILDEMDDTREERYAKSRKGMLRQFDGYRETWAQYVSEWEENGNLDRT